MFVSFILGGLILYANNFLIKKRKKELGIYMTLGMKKSKISLIMKIIAVVASLYGMLQSLDHWMFFTYFTNLSNIFIDIMLVIFIIYDLKKAKYIPQGMYLIKFMATISITLTFFVYMLLLAPTNSQGFIGAYLNNGAGSLCVHFITPVLAIIDFLLFSEHYRPDEKHVYYSVVPPLVYVGYVIVLGHVFHIRWYGDMLAPYNFLNYGAPTGWFGFDLSLLGSKTLGIGTFYMIVVLLIIFIGLGTLFLKLKRTKKDLY